MERARRWNIMPEDSAAQELAERLKTSKLLAQILLNRGLREPADCEAFLQPHLKTLIEPKMLGGMEVATQRIAQAVRDRQPIVIYGDYDVDGITATTILWHAITVLGGVVDYYIPHRVEEGYGLNAEAIAQICDGGARLIISVDCGVTAVAPAQVARERGVDLIITDHHEWHCDAEGNPELPDCFAIVHPRLGGVGGGGYANPCLCGAGVALKVAWGLGLAMSGGPRVSEEFKAYLMDAMALAALGTIADVVPLVGENRVIAQNGLRGLEKSRLRGLRALISSAGLTGSKLDSYDVGFRLAPRLNACGRMGHARLAVEMLTRADEARANDIALYLEQQNRARQAMEKQIFLAALEQVEKQKFDPDNCSALVLGGDGWHPGVIGIVASRMVERFYRPTLMVAFAEDSADEMGSGSGRSIAGFHLTQAMGACSEFLSGYGGHEMAAGLKIARPRFADFREAFCAVAKDRLTPEQLLPQMQVESLAELRHLNIALVSDLARLAPFGNGNARPLLAIHDAHVAGPPRRVGKNGDHLQMTVRQGETTMKCIAFGKGALADELKNGQPLQLAVEASLNEYQGRVNVELEVKDLVVGE